MKSIILFLTMVTSVYANNPKYIEARNVYLRSGCFVAISALIKRGLVRYSEKNLKFAMKYCDESVTKDYDMRIKGQR